MKINIFSFLLFYCAAAFCQHHEPVFEHISIDEGLFQSSVNCIMQDRRGFIWFGTNDGLARYDGYSSRVFRKGLAGSLSLPENNVTAVSEDNEGYIWIGTAGGYLCMYDPYELKIKTYKLQFHTLFIKHNEADFDILPVYSGLNSKSITSVIIDSSGSVWAGTLGSGLFRLSREQNKQVHYYYIRGENTISSDYVTSLAEGAGGDIWIATFGGGLNKLTRQIKNNKESNLKFIQCNKPGKGLYEVMNVTSLVVKDNKLWIASYDKGLYYHHLAGAKIKDQFYRKELRFYRRDTTAAKFITKLASGKNGDLWMGTYGSGLVRTDIKSGYAHTYEHSLMHTTSIDDNNIVAVTVDSTGLVWVSTLNGIGVNKFIDGKVSFGEYSKNVFPGERLTNNSITAMAEDINNNIWAGTLNGLNYFRRFEGKTDWFLNNPDDSNTVAGNYITSLLIDESNRVWLGTFSSGLDIYDPVKKTFAHFRYNKENRYGISSDRITSIIKDGNGNIWIGTSDAGLNRAKIENSKVQFIHYTSSELYAGSLPGNYIKQLLLDSENEFIALTGNGYLCRYNIKTDDFTSSKIYCAGYSDAEITCIYPSYEALYIGTASNGLFKTNIDNSKPAIQISTPVLRDKAIGTIFPYNDELFLATDYGIMRYDIKDSSVALYNTNDGLQGMKFYPGAIIKGYFYLYFGGQSGLSWLDPVSHSRYDYRDKAYISSFKASDIEFPVYGSKINLSEHQNSINIAFSLTDYTDPYKNQFLYKLEGYDKAWKYTTAGNHSAEYSSLPPGDYIFYVKGINSSGGKCKNIASLHFIIAPVFWKTWWFILFIIFAAASAAGVFIYLRINHFLAVERLKAKISADLHDSIGSGLTEIALLSDISQMEYNKLAGNTNASLETIAIRSRELIDSMSDIVWLVNPKPKSLYDLFIRLKEIYTPILSQKGVKFIVDINESYSQLNLSMEERQNIYLIFKEAINNSIKYNHAKNITFAAQREENYINISLRDDGRGFNPSSGKGNGVINMKKRAAAMNLSIDIISEPGRGSVVTLNIKL